MKPKISAVICELNPLHPGHAYLFRRAKEDAACLVAVMSGSFVQRGECAIYDKYTRAVSAVAAGANLVLELPYPWSSGSAAFFAAAGVHLSEAVGCTHLYFGSETGDLAALRQVAGVLDSEDFKAQFRAVGQAGALREELLRRACPDLRSEVFCGANDILGAEYCRCLRTAVPVPVKRIDGESASDLRRRLSAEIAASGENPTGAILPEKLQEVLFHHLRCCAAPPEGFAEGGGGVIRRLWKAAAEAGSGEEMFALAATKQYTAARLRRAALFAVTGTTVEMLRHLPRFTRVLAANEAGRAYLSGLRRETLSVEILTNARDRAALSGEAGSQHAHGAAADGIFALCADPPRPAGWLAAMHPGIL